MRTIRLAFAVLLTAVAGAAAVPAGMAADWPTQPVKIVVPWTAGGFTDVLGRMLAEKMAKSLGQPVIVENRPGASGGIGSEFVSRAAADGYTLLLTTSDALVYNVNVSVAHQSNPAANPKPEYDALRDFTQVGLIGTQPVLLWVGSQVPARNLTEFVTMAKTKPGVVSYGSSGEGSAVHLAMEMFSDAAGIRMIHVPYKGIAPAVNDVLGGQVHALFLSLQGAGGHFQSGKLRPLAITSLQRSPLAPDVPTMSESGYPNFQLTLWYGLAGPRGMPADVVARLNKAMKDAIADPEVRDRLTKGNTTPIGSSPEESRAFLESEIARWTTAVKSAAKKP